MAFESWRYLDPALIVEASIRLTESKAQRAAAIEAPVVKRKRVWTRAYRQARQLHVRQLMRGRT